MSEEVTKQVVIEFTGRNLVKAVADEVDDSITHLGINVRGVAMQFQMAGYSLNELNRLLFNNSVIGKDVVGVFQGIGAALRIVTLVENFAKMIGVLSAAEDVSTGSIIANTSARLSGVGVAIAGAAATAAATVVSWAQTAALTAQAIAQAVLNALLGPYGWMILAGAAIAGGAAIAWATGAIPSKQLGGPVFETGPYMLHAGEYVVPSAMRAASVAGGAAAGPTVVQINDPIFRNRSDMDFLVNRLKRMGKA